MDVGRRSKDDERGGSVLSLEPQQAASRVTSELENNWKNSSFSSVVLKKEKVKIDVLITQPIIIDMQLFHFWLDGIPRKYWRVRCAWWECAVCGVLRASVCRCGVWCGGVQGGCVCGVCAVCKCGAVGLCANIFYSHARIFSTRSCSDSASAVNCRQ